MHLLFDTIPNFRSTMANIQWSPVRINGAPTMVEFVAGSTDKW
ncbi:hypothetical protein KSS87_005423 [Heliosperma pusillum]|nr:hypothetical protein KSS87_005423 [Heliosperma pusillum]